MFKKLKDKLAEEVKSSPQRIQQFAQAAQAAVTSASSSISDITNNDLFSIGDNDSQQNRVKSQSSPSNQTNTFQDVNPLETSSTGIMDMSPGQDILENHRQRRLSNSSFASDISFRLPSYETPSMYHLQSDMEVSASEAEERGFSAGAVSLDRVTKEQLYAAYKRTQERYTKYRTQYGDLARHYKLLERENAKARSVLVETQDKALRRISELREQCSLEQSAKAHLEKALRIEIEERSMKIEALNTQIHLLQNNLVPDTIKDNTDSNLNSAKHSENEAQLINFSNDNEIKPANDEISSSEISALNNKVEKMEQLLNKYKDSLKSSKEKNSQLATELQLLSTEIENKNKEVQDLKLECDQLSQAKLKINELNNINEDLQNKLNAYDFAKTKELSTLEMDFQKSLEEITELKRQIEIFAKKEEEYAISLAENKLSIHKELEGKEAEIKSLKDSLTNSTKEIQSYSIIINDYKANINSLEQEKSKLTAELNESNAFKTKITELNSQIQELTKKCQSLEQFKTKADEEYKCLQLQWKQETAEKLAMIDRNTYLENRNKQITDENSKKTAQINVLENELKSYKKEVANVEQSECEMKSVIDDLNMWKNKCEKLELEMQEEKIELVKLQSEIEKLLENHELMREQNSQFRTNVTELKSENSSLKEQVINSNKIKDSCKNIVHGLGQVKQCIDLMSQETHLIKNNHSDMLTILKKQIDTTLNAFIQREVDLIKNKHQELKSEYSSLQTELTEQYVTSNKTINTLQDENNALKSKILEHESQINALSENLDKCKNEQALLLDSVSLLQREKEELLIMSNKYKSETVQLQSVLNDQNNHVTEFNKLRNENEMLSNKFKEIEILNIELQEKIVQLESSTNLVTNESKAINKDNILLQDSINELKSDNENLASKVLDLVSQNTSLSVENENIVSKNEIMTTLLSESQNKNTSLHEEITKLSSDKDTLTTKLLDLELVNKTLTDDFKKLEHENCTLLTKLSNVEMINNSLLEDNNGVKTEKEILCTKIIDLENLKDTLKAELESRNTELNKALESLSAIKKENLKLNDTNEEINSKLIPIRTLEESNKLLSEENTSLKKQLEDISLNVQELQCEINDIRKSHEELEKEKDHLSSVIERLENNENTFHSKETQTANGENNSTEQLINKEDAIKEVHLAKLDSRIETQNTKELNELKADNEMLKEDNRRLQSDVEGLQTYLTKISKENSELNNKLRELIATSEHSLDNNDLSHNLSDLMKEIEAGKDKMENLTRENNLLVEENLELRDQLLSHNYPPNIQSNAEESNPDSSALRLKCNNLQKEKIQTESRLIELEEINKSINSNMTMVQEKNEKLRLSNEKLERRLDEALVSLRHLHALQENTELEYLRNILYEYLTGSGTHSVTLAKVLAAIVKFDDSQTQLVLQKEKERQSFLRQLGLI